MSAFLFGVPAKLKTLVDRLTASRAANLDNLTAARAANLDNLDAPISGLPDSFDWTPVRAANLDFLDEPISGLPSGSDYTPARAAKLDLVTGQDFGPWLNDPKKMLIGVTDAVNHAFVRHAQTTVYPEDSNGGVTGWWGLGIDDHGAAVEISAANTWTTVCDLTGGGYLGAVMAPTYNVSAVFSSDIRITRDGVVTTFSNPANAYAAYSRLCLGGIPQQDQIIAAAGGSAGLSGYADMGFANLAKNNGYPVYTKWYVPHPASQFAQGLPMLRFDVGLKVEVRCSALGSTAANKAAYATYILDKGV